MQQKQVKADLHVHVDGNTNKEQVINYLVHAQKCGVKKLAFVEYGNLNVIDALLEIMREPGGIAKYYTGELVIGTELSCELDANHINPDGTNYDGNIVHILTYLSFKDAVKLKRTNSMFNRNKQQDYDDDFVSLCKKLCEVGSALGLEMPTEEELRQMNTPHIVKDLHAWICKDEKRMHEYKDILKITEEQIDNPSKFIRQLAEQPTGVLKFRQSSTYTVSQAIKEIKKVAPSAHFVVAHPAYMKDEFNAEFYLDSLLSIPPVIAGQNNFFGIETQYFLDTPQENEMLSRYADKHGLKKSAGSDSRVPGKDMFLDYKGERFLFKPQFGVAMGTALKMGKVQPVEEVEGKPYIQPVGNAGELSVDEDLLKDICIDCSREKGRAKKVEEGRV